MNGFFRHLWVIKEEAEASAGLGLDREEWVRAVEALLVQLEGWLRPGLEEGLLTLTRYRVEREEAGLGRYGAPALCVEIPNGQRVYIEPGARVVDQGTGRVDLFDGPNRTREAHLLRQGRDTWYLRPPGWGTSGNVRAVPLREIDFGAALERLID